MTQAQAMSVTEAQRASLQPEQVAALNNAAGTVAADDGTNEEDDNSGTISVYLSTYLSIYLFIYLSICTFTYLFYLIHVSLWSSSVLHYVSV